MSTQSPMSNSSPGSHDGQRNHKLWSVLVLSATVGVEVFQAFFGAVSRGVSRRNAVALQPPPATDPVAPALAHKPMLPHEPPFQAHGQTPHEDLGRAADKNMLPVSGPEAEERENLGIVLVVSAFLAAICGGIAFIYVYWFQAASNRLLGGTLAISLWGLGIALVVWAHSLMIQREAVEPREDLTSTMEERYAAADEFHTGENQIRRRKVLIGMSTAVIGIFAAAFVSLFRSFATPPGPSLFLTVWRRGQRLMTEKGEPVTVNSLEVGGTVTVFPESNIGSVDAQTVLIRVSEQSLQMPKERAHWAPMGYVAYSRVCTHAGCPVGEYEPRQNLLLCPCHQSTFNVLNAAQPTGGPAARPLPQLPLYVDPDGTLRAAGDFTQPPGPGFWGMPEPRSLS